MARYSFVSPFREAKFCGVPSCIFNKLGCAAGEGMLRNTDLEESHFINMIQEIVFPYSKGEYLTTQDGVI
jgi:hypothetical protein